MGDIIELLFVVHTICIIFLVQTIGINDNLWVSWFCTFLYGCLCDVVGVVEDSVPLFQIGQIGEAEAGRVDAVPFGVVEGRGVRAKVEGIRFSQFMSEDMDVSYCD